VIRMVRLGADILSVLRKKAHVCVRERTEKYRVGDSFKCAYDEKVTYVFVAFVCGEWRL